LRDPMSGVLKLSPGLQLYNHTLAADVAFESFAEVIRSVS